MTAPRHRLPNRRASVTFDIRHEGQAFAETLSHFSDGRTAELFLNSRGSSTSSIAALAHDASILISLGLQTGLTLEQLVHSIKKTASGEPASLIGAALMAALEVERGR
jgi:hypothetical protein